MWCIVCLLKRNLLTADDLGHHAVSGENGEVLDDESGFLAQFYGGRDNVGKAANILQRTIAPDLIGNIPP